MLRELAKRHFYNNLPPGGQQFVRVVAGRESGASYPHFVAVDGPTGPLLFRADDYREESGLKRLHDESLFIDIAAEKAGRRDHPVVWDIGANTGIISIPVIIANPTSQVFAFEPDPETVGKLRLNCDANSIAVPGDIQIVQAALTGVDGCLDFHVHSRLPACSSIGTPRWLDTGDEVTTIQVQASRADSLELPHPDIVVMDVEGHEVQALEGFGRKIRPEHILVELHTPETRDCVSGMLVNWGYNQELMVPRGEEWHAHFTRN